MANEIQELLGAGVILSKKGHIVGFDGNLSIRDHEGFVITPSGVPKGELGDGDLVHLDLEGKPQDPSKRPSSELAMHMVIYRHCAQARAVIHAHPIKATSWSLQPLKWLPDLLPEVLLACGAIPIVPYATPGTPQMAKVLEPFLPEHRVMILARHGVLVWGESVAEALRGVFRVEQVCHILSEAFLLGGSLGGSVEPLSQQEIQSLRSIRTKLAPTIL